jgi:hypothetical protein
LDLKVFLQSSLDDCYVAHDNTLDMIGCVHGHDLNISGILEDCFHQERDRFAPDEWEAIFYITLAHLIFPWLLFWLYKLLFGTSKDVYGLISVLIAPIAAKIKVCYYQMKLTQF